jgi:predicted nucleotidyltransferase
MRRDDAIALITSNRKFLNDLGVKSLNLFGSVARDEARPDSDVDLLVEFDRPKGLFQLLEVKFYLEDLLGCPVDLGTEQALREHARDNILQESICVF